MSNGANRLVMADPRDQAPVHELKNTALVFTAALAAAVRSRRIWRFPLGER